MVPPHRGATRCHLGDMSRPSTGDTEGCQGTAGRLGTRTIIPPCTTGTVVFVNRLSLGKEGLRLLGESSPPN